jgi:hypothetical protein
VLDNIPAYTFILDIVYEHNGELSLKYKEHFGAVDV